MIFVIKNLNSAMRWGRKGCRLWQLWLWPVLFVVVVTGAGAAFQDAPVIGKLNFNVTLTDRLLLDHHRTYDSASHWCNKSFGMYS